MSPNVQKQLSAMCSDAMFDEGIGRVQLQVLLQLAIELSRIADALEVKQP